MHFRLSFLIFLFTMTSLSVRADILKDDDKALLSLSPEQLLKAPLSVQSTQRYWQKHGVVSPSKSGENPFDSPSAIYIISKEELQRLGVTSVVEALRSVPGLHVARMDAHKWAVTARGFNGQFANKLLVLIDGRSVYTPLFSGTFWENQNELLEDIERIEVIRGPGTSQWGTNAVNGVVNIITKHSAHSQGNYILSRFGNDIKRFYATRHGGRFGKEGSYRVYAKHFDQKSSLKRNGNKAFDDWQQGSIGARFDWKTDHTRYTLHSDFSQHDDKNYANQWPKLPTLSSPQNTITQRVDKSGESAQLTFSLDHNLSPRSTLYWKQYIDYNKFGGTTLSREALTFDGDFRHQYLYKRHQLHWGLGYRYIKDDIDDQHYLDYSPNRMESHLFSAFIQDKFTLIPEKLFITLGSKFEHNHFTGYEYQPNARLAWYPDNRQTVWAAFSRALRLPTRGENGLILRTKGVTGGYVAQVGRQNGEILYASELGHRIHVKKNMTLDSTLFYNNYQKLGTDSLGPPITDISDPVNVAFYSGNLGRAKTYGFESSATWQASTRLKLKGSYSFFYIDLDLPDTVVAPLFYEDETDAPTHQFNLHAYLDLSQHIQWDNHLYYVDHITSYSDSSYPFDIPAYTRFDSRLSWKPISGLHLSLVGQNLLDPHHQEFSNPLFTSPNQEQASTIGRTFMFSLSWTF